jgi:hypothetical protein
MKSSCAYPMYVLLHKKGKGLCLHQRYYSMERLLLLLVQIFTYATGPGS